MSTSRLHDALADPAADARARFGHGDNGYLEGSKVVHAVRLQDWLGVSVPGPGCHVGTGGWDFTRFKPTRSPVDCGRCSKSRLHGPVAEGDLPGQLGLDLGPDYHRGPTG
ncbi:hypothetical protein [Umezawaea tangerina]|uniref:Uncharacterized protein n=1 Tax=Umezawaea tangerina TaxID=84725 RepID=A0A2T0T1A7_9PSEU|nr:hypothetical protein [Umezawaea tangerina]PRY39450.1 hypothetical protein CLV43_10733 [Umezawaea tangerina]